MAFSRRFPFAEINDALRQLWYIPAPFYNDDGVLVDRWAELDRDNPFWQISQRRRYSLNTDTKRYKESPWRPPVAEYQDDTALIAPKLFDNIIEFNVAVSTSSAPTTGIIVQFRGTNPAGYVDPIGPGNTDQSMAVYDVFIILANQDSLRSRLLRYLNWFNSVILITNRNRPLRLERFIVRNPGEIAKFLISNPVPITISNVDSSRITGMASVVEMGINGDVLGGISDPLTPNDPDDPFNIIKP